MTLILRTACLLSVLACGPVWAQYAPQPPLPPPDPALLESGPIENVGYGYAQVLRVDPVYENVRYTTPEQHCDGEVYERVGGGGDPTGGTVVGAIVGGLLGNQVGGGDGRKAATVAGAIAGGAVGRHLDSSNGPEGGPVQAGCRTVQIEHSERRIAGYDVEYRYFDKVYGSRLTYDPGDRLRVRTTVSPADDELGVR